MKSGSGYSLTDLLLWLTIVGIIVGIAAPSGMHSLQKKLLKFEAYRLARFAERLALKATQTGCNYELVIDRDFYLGKSEECIVSKAERIELHPGFSLEMGGNNSNVIRLYKSGVATPATILVTAKNQLCKVSISLRGRIKDSC